ncbi:hypothetical protein E2C01_102679 [Portunus trituberculatus]|uniref:Uncharacterized protein n=1 Tax=Portunus trituberculatus TaxID=210409 RepID=A0A5B7KN49_PORTR|nr:hypothetical protein [Portunus trituberculatus]
MKSSYESKFNFRSDNNLRNFREAGRLLQGTAQQRCVDRSSCQKDDMHGGDLTHLDDVPKMIQILTGALLEFHE